MEYILQLSGEHPTLPRGELDAVLEGESISYTSSEMGGLTRLQTESDDPSFLLRLAYTLKAEEVLAESDRLDELAGMTYEAISEARTFRVTGRSEVQKKLGKLLYDLGLKVDLKRPEADVCVHESGGGYVAGLDIPLRRGYQARRPQYRPYFHPTSMHPKLARALVNLARVCPGDTILDPFCGTGGILIEAGLMGLDVIGWDVDGGMAEGCLQNLRAYDISGEVLVRDAVKSSGEADAIATDPPYGRSSRPSEETSGLYRKFVKNARGILEGGSYMALMLPADRALQADGFCVRETFDVRMHKSLTRRIWVLEAI